MNPHRVKCIYKAGGMVPALRVSQDTSRVIKPIEILAKKQIACMEICQMHLPPQFNQFYLIR